LTRQRAWGIVPSLPFAVNTMEANEISGLKFEAALGEIEKIVRCLEEGRIDLEGSIAAYRRGTELVQHCRALLDRAQKELEVSGMQPGASFPRPGARDEPGDSDRDDEVPF